MFFANVIVDISHEKLDKTFQYIIPDTLLGSISVGTRVNIPFGKGNRIISGYVVGITDIPEFLLSKMKCIGGVMDKSIPLETHLIKLAAWIKENYGSTMNQALKVVVPVKKQIKTNSKKYIRLIISLEEATEWLDKFQRDKRLKARYRLLTELIQNNELSGEIVTGKLNISSSTIKGLEKLGIVEVISERVYRSPINIREMEKYSIVLNQQQQEISDQIAIDIEKNNHSTHLIHGVTGSGKTEIYIELINKALKQGKEAIVLIPEIALTYQTVKRFYQKFGDKIAIINSRLSAGERYDQFEMAKQGKIKIMIGPRSALFTPFQNLGIIIIDEEHEGAYKSEGVPKYHTREVAIERARMLGATVVLGSATPSVESYYKANAGEYQLHKLSIRAKDSRMAEVDIVDLREELQQGNKSIFSRRLRELIIDRLEKNEQIMLFINRRGYAGFVSCRSCGHVIKCVHCDVSLTAHNNGHMVCHYCGYDIQRPQVCPECGSKYISTFGIGTQQVETLVKKEFPTARTLRMDADTTRNKNGHEEILSTFANGQADILIGTQMIVKGHDFPNVTLVGVLAADLSLYASDYRASERTFQLLTQAAGRAGRGNKHGEVVIQTYSPDNYCVTTASEQDYGAFYEEEISYRMIMRYPPVFNLMAILITAQDEDVAVCRADSIADILKDRIKEIAVIGPNDAIVSKINDIYRKVIYIKAKEYDKLVEAKNMLESELDSSQIFKDISVQFDFTPMSNL